MPARAEGLALRGKVLACFGIRGCWVGFAVEEFTAHVWAKGEDDLLTAWYFAKLESEFGLGFFHRVQDTVALD